MSIPNQPMGASAQSIPTGTALASYTSYEDAQRAVDHLSDTDHNVRLVSIVGEDLRLVERITGSLNYGKVAGSGAATGAWFGLMMALVLWLVIGNFGFLDFVIPVVVGAAFGVLLGIVSYAIRPKTRDFTSASTVVAKRYTVIAGPAVAQDMRAALQQAGLLGGAPAQATAPTSASHHAAAGPSGAGQAGPGRSGGQDAWTPGRPYAGETGSGPVAPPSQGGDTHTGAPYGGAAHGGVPTGAGAYGGASSGSDGHGGDVHGGDGLGGAPAGAGAVSQGGDAAGAGSADSARPPSGIAPAADGTPRYGARLEDLSPEQRAHAEDQLRQADAHRAVTDAGQETGQGPDQR